MSELFADTLRRLRTERGLSQRELAREMYVTQSTVARWENGSRLPDAAMISRLAERLGVDVGTLMSAAAESGGSPNVIMVEDREVILTGGLSVLEEVMPDATVVGFEWPSEAVEYARENRVSLAFLDIELGDESGFDLCRALLEANPRTNVVYLTAYADYALDAWGTGASGFMLKPITPEGVRAQLADLRYPFPLGGHGRMSGYWLDMIEFSVVGAMLLTAVLGIALAAAMPGMDRWNRRFFACFFALLALCACSIFVESVADGVSAMAVMQKPAAWLESLFTSAIVAMPAPYLLHCCGEDWRKSALLRAVLALWALFIALLITAQLTTDFYYFTPSNQFAFGPWYALMGAPLVAISALILLALIRRRDRLSSKRFYALLVFLVPLTAAMVAHMLAPSFGLLYAGVAVSALAMFVIVVSEEIDRHMSLQREAARQRAKLAVLQMRPHFIHNTMTSIYYLCDQDPKVAQRVTMDFNTYLRKNFNAIVKDEAIPFAEELEHTRAYLAVERAQFGSKLVVEFDTPHTAFRLPPLTLQPLAENAVKHGMDPDTVPLRICIKTRKTEAGSVIVVEDSGPGFDPSLANDPHTTLANIRQRLEMMCGGTLDIAPREGGGTVVRVSIP